MCIVTPPPSPPPVHSSVANVTVEHNALDEIYNSTFVLGLESVHVPELESNLEPLAK